MSVLSACSRNGNWGCRGIHHGTQETDTQQIDTQQTDTQQTDTQQRAFQVHNQQNGAFLKTCQCPTICSDRGGQEYNWPTTKPDQSGFECVHNYFCCSDTIFLILLWIDGVWQQATWNQRLKTGETE